MTAEERGHAVAMLVQAVREDGTFAHGDLQKIRDHFQVDRTTIWRLWKRAKTARIEGKIVQEEFGSKKNLQAGALFIYQSR
jgi:hypothetical protein